MPDPYREPTENVKGAEPKIERSVLPETLLVPEVEKEKTEEAPAQQKIEPSVLPVPGPSPQAAASDDLSDASKDRQLKILVDMAFEQGIDKAVQAAKASEDPYLIDKFHDTLIDELYQKLVEKGKLKES